VGKKKNTYTKAIAYRLKVPFNNSLIATQNLTSKGNAYDHKGAMDEYADEISSGMIMSNRLQVTHFFHQKVRETFPRRTGGQG
jgi:hypothetical protein